MKLKTGQKVQLEIDGGGERVRYEGEVREINPPMFKVYFPDQKEKIKFPLGSFQHIRLPGGHSKKVRVKIERNNAVPFIDLRILGKKDGGKGMEEKGARMETSSLRKILKEVDDHEYIKIRSSLRVADSFPVEFYLQTGKRAVEKKEDYINAPTKERKKRFLLDRGIVPPAIFQKISGMEADMFDVFADIYRRLAVMSGKDIGIEDEDSLTEKKVLVPEENTGTCIDISGKGLKFLCGTPFRPGDVLKIIISPTAAVPGFSVSALAEVMKTVLVEDGFQSQRYAVIVKYHAINEEDLGLLTRYTVLRHTELQARAGKK